mmetsp:Transcript_44246/g.109553  ORF Transcript_44246/g.109553 Transcript_44246/m.109553 type:complete len:258 (+) Transcript_44246:515-1288(+)
MMGAARAACATSSGSWTRSSHSSPASALRGRPWCCSATSTSRRDRQTTTGATAGSTSPPSRLRTTRAHSTRRRSACLRSRAGRPTSAWPRSTHSSTRARSRLRARSARASRRCRAPSRRRRCVRTRRRIRRMASASTSSSSSCQWDAATSGVRLAVRRRRRQRLARATTSPGVLSAPQARTVCSLRTATTSSSSSPRRVRCTSGVSVRWLLLFLTSRTKITAARCGLISPLLFSCANRLREPSASATKNCSSRAAGW